MIICFVIFLGLDALTFYKKTQADNASNRDKTPTFKSKVITWGFLLIVVFPIIVFAIITGFRKLFEDNPTVTTVIGAIIVLIFMAPAIFQFLRVTIAKYRAQNGLRPLVGLGLFIYLDYSKNRSQDYELYE